jgi:hypothetical protein
MVPMGRIEGSRTSFIKSSRVVSLNRLRDPSDEASDLSKDRQKAEAVKKAAQSKRQK